MKASALFGNIVGWLAGLLLSLIGIINIGWGNDRYFGIFVLLGSLIFYPPGQRLFKRLTGYQVPWYLLLIWGAFLFWSALGVGELAEKIKLMRQSTGI